MRTLFLLRHGKSDWKQEVSADFDRPLNERGRDASDRVGQWMRQHHLQPEWVVCSPSKRTRETLAQLRAYLSVPDTLIDFDDQIYLADIASLLAVLTRSPQDVSNVLLVGHNPGMEQLLIYFCGESPPLSKKGKLMPTASLAQIALPDDWHALAPASGKLVQIIRPEDLA